MTGIMKSPLLVTRAMTGMLVTAMVFLSMATACHHDEDADYPLTFIGDSEVALWDTHFFFPGYVTTNVGKSGAVLADIEEMGNIAQGTYAVIILGTNNIHQLSEETIADYAERYVVALENLHGIRTFVFSIFPRGFEGDKAELNHIIKLLNAMIKEKCLSRPTFTYMDVYSALERDNGIHPEYSFDGLHLSRQGYEIITGELKKWL